MKSNHRGKECPGHGYSLSVCHTLYEPQDNGAHGDGDNPHRLSSAFRISPSAWAPRRADAGTEGGKVGCDTMNASSVFKPP